MAISRSLFLRYYPNDARNGTVAFYQWLRQYLRPNMIVLNVGAGPATKQAIRTIKGEVSRVVGVDIDSIVRENAELDEAHVVTDDRYPFADATFDLAFADYVLEHIEHPGRFLAEIRRVLRPGSAFFFRTPNLFHYVALASWLTPYWFHRLTAHWLRGLSSDVHEPWPTFYRLNTVHTIRRIANEVGFSTVTLRLFEPNPSYLVFSSMAFRLGVAYERLVNSLDMLSGFRGNIFGKLER